MKNSRILFFLLLVLLISCQGPGQKASIQALNDSIASLEKEIFDPANEKLDKIKAVELISLYLKAAHEDPDSEKAPEYLFKAADISINVQSAIKTISIYDEILDQYPDYKKAPTVMFLKAFVYDDQLHDYVSAEKNYKLFLEKYPDSEFADDAEISLKNLGKTPEELIEEFQKNNP
jgi:outer membrane protein assembly factor BamD (BamD/ComL family)